MEKNELNAEFDAAITTPVSEFETVDELDIIECEQAIEPELLRPYGAGLILMTAELIDEGLLAEFEEELSYFIAHEDRPEIRLDLSRLEVAGGEAIRILREQTESAAKAGKHLRLTNLNDSILALLVHRGLAHRIMKKQIQDRKREKKNGFDAKARDAFQAAHEGEALSCPADKKPIDAAICFTRQSKTFGPCALCSISLPKSRSRLKA